MSEYTKGQWDAGKPKDGNGWCEVHEVDGCEIATIWSVVGNEDGAMGNARLISAAPDYDEAACEFIEAWEDGGCMDELKGIYFKFVSAKAKARGRE